MQPLPEGTRLKLDRAQRHLDWLNERLDELERGRAFAFRTYANADGTEHDVRVIAKRTPQASWSVRIGELLFNLRSALDQLIVTMVKEHGGTVTSALQFPIFAIDDSRTRASFRKQAAGLCDAALAELRSIQPYNGRNSDHPLFKFFESLRLLHELNRLDKHRFLHLIVALAEEFAFPLEQFPEGRFDLWPLRVVDDGTLLGTFHPAVPLPYIKVNGELSVVVVIEETSETPELSWGVLESMIDAAESCAARMRPFLGCPGSGCACLTAASPS